MVQRFGGGCQCGNIRYEIQGALGELVVCHCVDCQKQSSSAFGMSLDIKTQDFVLTAGKLKTFEWRCDSGRIKICAFCPDCGSRIYHTTEDGKSLKAGTLDQTAQLEPVGHYWTDRRQKWFEIPVGHKQTRDDG